MQYAWRRGRSLELNSNRGIELTVQLASAADRITDIRVQLEIETVLGCIHESVWEAAQRESISGSAVRKEQRNRLF